MPAWPALLPMPAWPGIGIKPADPVARTEMEAGPSRNRRRYTRVPTGYSFSIEFDRVEMDVFESWHHWEIHDGESWFDMPMANGRGINTVSCRFIKMWEAKTLGNALFQVAFELEVENRPVMSQVDLQGYL